jgi:hypothetical protein
MNKVAKLSRKRMDSRAKVSRTTWAERKGKKYNSFKPSKLSGLYPKGHKLDYLNDRLKEKLYG